MTTRLFTVFLVFFTALLASLVPVPARSQEQSQPSPTIQVQPRDEQNRPGEEVTPPEQQPGTVTVPPAEKKEEPAEESGSAKEGGTSYVVKRGDTLWDISNAFLKNPFLWPFIWKANPSIANPDLIIPGANLAIPNLAPIEQAMNQPAPKEAPAAEPSTEFPKEKTPEAAPSVEAPAKPQEEAQAPGNKLILPEEAPIPIMDKYSMLNAGFINQDKSSDRIVASKEGKTIMSYDDIVYVSILSRKDAALGDKFLIYTPLDVVKHPVTHKKSGTLIKVLGVLQLIEKGKSDIYSARVTISFDSIEPGSMLAPYQEPTLIYDNSSQAKAKDISGYILEVVDTRSINATTDIVYLDKGSADGVDPGDRFVIYGKTEKASYPRPVIGETQVFLVKEHSSTAAIHKSSNTVERGDFVQYKK